ncbi:MAG: sigma 54-interacting transcriptional regulator [Desulfobacterales bacterium]
MFDHEMNEYWKTVVDTIQDGIMIVDKAGTIVSANKAFEKITGYDQTQIIGEPCTRLNCHTCEAAREKRGDHWCVLFRIGAVRQNRCAVQRADGSYITVLKNASLLYDNHSKVIGAVETLTDISELLKKEIQIEAFRRELSSRDGFQGILGDSGPMHQVFDLISNAARSDAPVIIFGESGTGKELVAAAIHNSGSRHQKPYLKVNCAALNASLLESELFGHVKGAFTGAFQNRKGRFEAAQGGDIFLDEIGDLPLSTQVKLLRVLEEKVIERVGDNRSVHIDVRIISGTNRNLKDLVDSGLFREDLFYRINVIPIIIPPLRDRRSDIPLLAESFFRRIRLKNDKNIQAISNLAMETLMNYAWPGNVRELKSALEYAFVTCNGVTIEPQHLPPDVFQNNLRISQKQNITLDRNEIQKHLLINALKQTSGNQTHAARILGVSRITVWNRMKKYGINPVREFVERPS